MLLANQVDHNDIASFRPLAHVSPKPQRTSLGNLEIDTLTQHDFTEEVLDHALHGQVSRQIATVNAQFYVLAEKMLAFRACLHRVEYLCADGMPIVWACKTFGKKSVPRIAGVDLVADLCHAGAPHNLRIFLLGGRPGTASDTAKLLSDRFPGLQIAGVLCPPQGFELNQAQLQETLELIDAAKPHVLFVALGAPKQELFIDRHIRPLRIPIAVGIGGSFEILSGQAQRAPEWMRSKGLEWFYRFIQEPRRLWRRYLIGNTEFVWCLLKWRYRLLRQSQIPWREENRKTSQARAPNASINSIRG
jgi:N-acetylglucosaminyldiphosphoundecaprenol N-acetyl-beta-D-mannosaminyltransferase